MPPSAATSDLLVGWDRASWRGEPAWTSVRSGVRATVSETRARLIYLGAADGSVNLLNAPWPHRRPDALHPWPNQGGHRFWLGPQHRWVWPPPAEWEYAAARSVSAQGGLLTVEHQHLDPAYPALMREYGWADSRLRCTVRWTDNGARYFGLHVVAIDTPFRVTARLAPCADAPTGLVAARMTEPEAPVTLPQPAIVIDDGHATVHGGRQRAKFGFVPQPLAIERPSGWSLTVHPGPASTAEAEAPDHGYLSQVWVGEEGCELAELEQLTPHLRGDEFGRCASTIFIEATPPTL